MSRISVVVLALDIIIVMSFVLFGRETHESPFDIAESTRIAAPFVAGLAVAWLIPQIRASSLRIVSGVFVGATTAVVGIALRSLVLRDGISGAFPFVTVGYMVGLMSLIRVVLTLRARSQS